MVDTYRQTPQCPRGQKFLSSLIGAWINSVSCRVPHPHVSTLGPGILAKLVRGAHTRRFFRSMPRCTMRESKIGLHGFIDDELPPGNARGFFSE
jgi:hypothetical protein